MRDREFKIKQICEYVSRCRETAKADCEAAHLYEDHAMEAFLDLILLSSPTPEIESLAKDIVSLRGLDFIRYYA